VLLWPGVVEAAIHRTRIVQIVGSGVTGEWAIVAIRPLEQFKNAYRASQVIAGKKNLPLMSPRCRNQARAIVLNPATVLEFARYGPPR